MQRRVERLFDKMKPHARAAGGKLSLGAIEVVIAVGEAKPQWPHVDVLTLAKLQVLGYLNGVRLATQLARYDGDPVEWAEAAYDADRDATGLARERTWQEQAGEDAELAAVTALSGTEDVIVTPVVAGPVPAGTVQAIASRDAVHFGPASSGLRFLFVFVVAATPTDMDYQEVPLQKAGPDALAELGLRVVAQLLLPHVRAEMGEDYFQRRRKGYDSEFKKETWPNRTKDRPVFTLQQWDKVVRTAKPPDSQGQGSWVAFREELRCAAAAYRARLDFPRRPHRQVQIIPVGAQKEHLRTMKGVCLERLLHGKYVNGDAMPDWSSRQTSFTHRFEEAEVGRVDVAVATITPTDGGPAFMIGLGDVVEFDAGFECIFTVHERMERTLVYLDKEGEIQYDTSTITCDKCSRALEADVPRYREHKPDVGEPAEWCVECFQTTTDQREFVKQVRGGPVGFRVKPRGKRRRDERETQRQQGGRGSKAKHARAPRK